MLTTQEKTPSLFQANFIYTNIEVEILSQGIWNLPPKNIINSHCWDLFFSQCSAPDQ